jgi:diphthine methyl ester acylhydrolase
LRFFLGKSIQLSFTILRTIATTIQNEVPDCEMSRPKWSQAVTPILSTTLDLPPSCIEFVPRARDKLPCFQTGEYFVVGTYYLQKEAERAVTPDVGTKASHPPESSEDAPQSYLEAKPQSRKGSLTLFKLSGNNFRAQGQKL